MAQVEKKSTSQNGQPPDIEHPSFYPFVRLSVCPPPSALWTEAAPIHAKFWILRCRFFFKNLFIIVLLSRVQGFNNFQNIFHVKKLLQSYISPYNSIKQNKNFISIHFHKMLYTARKIFLFCFQKYRSFLSYHIALGATAHGNWGRKGRKGKELILNEEEVEG